MKTKNYSVLRFEIELTLLITIVFRFGMEQTELKTIVQDILELDLNNDWEVGIKI